MKFCYILAYLLSLVSFVSCQPSTSDKATQDYLKQYTNQNQPLQVDYTSPIGETKVKQNKIVIHFTQPMVALSAIGGKAAADIVRIEPKPDGYFKWVNTKTLVYQVKGNLPYATSFNVTILSGKESLLGYALIKDTNFQFFTAPPKIKSVFPKTGAQNLELKQPIKVTWNQKIDPNRLSDFVKLNLDDSQVIPFTIECEKTNENVNPEKYCDKVVIIPQKEIPKSRLFDLQILKGVSGVEGSDVSNEAVTYRYKTYGDFNITNLSCQNNLCQAYMHLLIGATTPIDEKEAYKFMEFEPEVKGLKSADSYWSNQKNSLNFYVNLQPNTEYKLTLKPGLKDNFGQILKEAKSFSFKTEHLSSSFDFPYITDQILNYHENLDFGFVATNIKSAIANFKLDLNDQVIIELFNSSSKFFEDIKNENSWDYTKEYFGQIDDLKKFHSIPYIDILKDKKSSIILSLYQSPEVTSYNSQTKAYNPRKYWFVKQVTDLAIDAKISANDGLIWVTSLNLGEDQSSTNISIYNNGGHLLYQGTTNAQGLLQIPGFDKLADISKRWEIENQSKKRFPFYIFAKKGSDRAFITTNWTEGLGYYYYPGYYDSGSRDTNEQNKNNDDIKNKTKVRAHILTDRGLYKPGEEVKIKGYLRQVTESGLDVFIEPIILKIKEPLNDKPIEIKISPNHRGNFSTSFLVNKNNPLGYYQISLKSEQPWVKFESAYAGFQVQKFRTPEFKVLINFPKNNYVKGEELNAKFSSEYLFGSPLKGAKLKYFINKNLASFEPTNDKDWLFGRLYDHRDTDEAFVESSYKEDQTKLNDQGEFELNYATKNDIVDPISYYFEGQVYDLSGQSLSARTNMIVHPASYYIGAKLDKLFFDADEQINIYFASLTPDGHYLSDKDIHIDLMRVKWISVKKESLYGQFKTQIERKEEKLSECSKKTVLEENSCQFFAKESGYYFLKLTSKDEKNRLVITEVPLYVSGNEYGYWPAQDDNSIDLVLDKKKYKNGDTAKILIKSPYQRARALVSFERDHVLSYEVKELEGSTPVLEIPIKEKYAPNVFVSVVLIKGALDIDPSQKENQNDLTQALVKVGKINIEVEPQGKDLQLTLQPSQKIYKPGDVVDLALNVGNLKANEESEITVMVVDEGVLLAGGYQLKNPLDTFYAPYFHNMSQMDARTHFVGMQGLEEKLAEPPSGGGRMDGFRQKFIPLAYYNGDIETKDGKAQISFKLPDQLTTFKIMAIANANVDQFGLGLSEIKTQKELMIRPAMPRFLRIGDKIKSKVVLHNNTDSELTVNLEVKSKDLKLISGQSSKIKIPAKSSQTALVGFETNKDQDQDSTQAEIEFFAKSQNLDDRVMIKLPVYYERQKEVVATSGVSSGTVSEFVEKNDDMDPGFGSLDIQLSANLLVKLKNKIKALQDYPYDCLEQRLSKIYPFILESDKNFLFSDEAKDPSFRYNKVKKFISYLKSQQNYQGGFSFWPGSKVNPALTLMVGEFLVYADHAGHDVKQVLDKIIKLSFSYLKGSDESLKSYSEAYLLKLKIQALYLHYLTGKPQVAYYYGLRSEVDKMDSISAAKFMELLFAEDSQDPLVSQWIDSLNKRIRLKGELAYVDADSSSYYFGNSQRMATAKMLQTLLKIDPAHTFVFPMLRYIVESKSQFSYISSLELLEILKAMMQYQSVFPGSEQPVEAKLKMNDKELFTTVLTLKRPEDQLDMPINKLPTKMSLNVINTTKNILFYNIRFHYALKDFRPYGLEEGISLGREYYDLNGHPVAVNQLKHGETYKVVLNFFFADAVDYLVVEEVMAAGLEPVNFALKTERLSYNNTKHASGNDLKWWLDHKEFHDKKILLFANHVPRGFFDFEYYVNVTNFGEYIVPPAKAMEMYHPEVFGTTGKEVVQIQ